MTIPPYGIGQDQPDVGAWVNGNSGTIGTGSVVWLTRKMLSGLRALVICVANPTSPKPTLGAPKVYNFTVWPNLSLIQSAASVAMAPPRL